MNNLTKSQRATLKKNILKYNLPYPTDFRSKKNRDIIDANLGMIEVDIISAKIDARKEQLRQASRRYRQKKREQKQVRRWIGNVAIGVKYIRADTYINKKGEVKDTEKEFYYYNDSFNDVLGLKSSGINPDADLDMPSGNVDEIAKVNYYNNRGIRIPKEEIKNDELYITEYDGNSLNLVKKGIEQRDLNKLNGKTLKEHGITRPVKYSLYNIPINIQSTKEALHFWIDRKIKEYIEINKLNYAYIVDAKYDILYYKITDIDETIELSYDDIKMREQYAVMIDGYDWKDTDRGVCVFDYIKSLLGDVKGFKSICNNYDEIECIMRKTPYENLQKDGVSISHIINFCKKYNLPIYILGDFGKSDIIYSYKPVNINPNARTLCFRMSNNHIYPIMNKNEIKSIIALKNIRENISSSYFQEIKKEDNDNDKQDNNSNIIYSPCTFETLANIIKTKNIVPRANNIKIKDGQIKSFKIGNDVYIRDEFMPNAKILAELFDIDFKGQSIGGLTAKIYKDLYNEDSLPVSTYNPEVKDALLIAKKNRGHHGFMKDYDTTDTSLTSIDINKCYRKCLYDPINDFMILDINDVWEDYNNEDLCNGLYIVETNDITLLKGNDVYSGAILQVARDNDISFTIKKQLIPKRFVSRDKFKLFIDTIMKKFDIYNIKDMIKNKICTTTLDDIKQYKPSSNVKDYDKELKKYKKLKQQTQNKIDKEYKEYEKIVNKLDYELYKQTEKLVINSLSGMLGRHEEEKIIASVNKDIKQVLTFISKQNIKDTFLYKLPDIEYYVYGLKNKTIKNETTIPIYLQMLDQSNIMIYNLMKRIESVGGEVLARKIDCVVCRNLPEDFGMLYNEENDSYYNDEGFGNNWGDYRFDNKLPKLYDYEKKLDKTFNFQDWFDYNIINNSDQYEDIIELIKETKGMLIQGRAGTGKSYIIHKITEHFGDDKVLKLAFTNKASLNISGSTIHRVLGINKNDKINKKMINKIKNYDYIIIDEVSMLNKKLWNLIYLLKNSLPDIGFLLFGDYRQIVGIEENKKDIIEDYFNHPCMKFICNYNRITLTEVKRYDTQLLKISDDVYSNKDIDISKYPLKKNARRNICYFNNTRKRINEYWNNKENTSCSLFIPEDKDDDYTQDIYIYNNCPIIARKNNYDDNGDILYANSETFNVICFNNTYIYLQNEMNTSLKVDVVDFNKNFALNYCTTTHKTQGETITEDFNIYDWKFMDKKLKYTAITRAKNINNIGICL